MPRPRSRGRPNDRAPILGRFVGSLDGPLAGRCRDRTGHANVGFQNFLADMGPRSSAKHTLDRIDNDGHYEPGNVRWAPPKVQARNKRTNICLTWQGQTHSLAEWAERLGLAYETLRHRHQYLGWSVEQTLTPPQWVPLSLHEAAERRRASKRKFRAANRDRLNANERAAYHRRQAA